MVWLEYAIVNYIFTRFCEVRPEFRQNQIAVASRACNLAWRRMLHDLARGHNYWKVITDVAVVDTLFRTWFPVSPTQGYNVIACVSRYHNICWRRNHRRVMHGLLDTLEDESRAAANRDHRNSDVRLQVADLRDAYN